MNLKEFANVDSLYRDINTGTEISWRDYMRRVIDKLGIDNVRTYIPFDLNYLKEKYKDDIHFNNTSVRIWDAASGFMPMMHNKTKAQAYHHFRMGLADLFIHNGITCFSPSDCVCVLKETARILCEGDIDDHS